MTLYIACRDWLGLAVALRLKQARPDLDIGLPAPDPAIQTVLSAKAAAWLGALDPALAPNIKATARRCAALIVGRGGEQIVCRGQNLVAFDGKQWAGLQSALLAQAGLSKSLRPPKSGEMIIGIGPRGNFVSRDVVLPGDIESARIQLPAMPTKARAQMRIVPLPDRQILLRLLWPGVAAKPDADEVGTLLRAAAIEEHAAVDRLMAQLGERPAAPSPAPDFNLGGEADLLAVAGGENEIALIEALAGVVAENGDPAAIRAKTAAARDAIKAASQHANRNLLDWHADPARYAKLPIGQLAYSLLSASQRIGHQELASVDPQFVAEIEAKIATHAGLAAPVAPMFTPFKMRALSLANRVVVSPMCMYSAQDGTPSDFHLVHLGARALGGAGLVLTEMTDVSAEGRISPGCTGIYDDAHIEPWKRIVDFVHGGSASRIGLQLGHAGPKASTQLGWQRMDEPLADGNWPILAASAQAYGPRNQLPKAMDEADLDRVERQFAHATERAIACGFDMIELHFAHGYLLSSFISPLTNLRSDRYGGSLENRLRFPLRIFEAVRALWPQERPISVRLSASDWAPGGVDIAEAVAIARAFAAAGADALTVSSGQTTRLAKPLYGRMYQVPFSDRIRQEAGIPTIAVGAITEADQINSIVAAGRADLCALARPHLVDAAWTLHAAVALGHGQQRWPKQYLAGKAQAERETARPPLRGAA